MSGATPATETSPEKGGKAGGGARSEAAADGAGGLPEVESGVAAGEVLPALEGAAKRGRLPGFQRVGEYEFVVDAFGAPFDYELRGRVEAEGASARVLFSLRRKPRMPIVFAVVLLLTVEPGQYFVDQLIPGAWGWIDTRWWYYPLTILPLPWVWWSLSKRSRVSAHEHAREQIGKIETALGSRSE